MQSELARVLGGGLTIWQGVWFSVSDRYQYGIFRMVMVAVIAFDYRRFIFTANRTASVFPAELMVPSLVARWSPLPVPLPSDWRPWIERLVILLLATSFAGLATRPSLVALALLTLYLGGTDASSWGFVVHLTNIPAVVLLIAAFAPGATDCSLDGFLSSAWSAAHGGGWPPLASLVFGAPAYVWPARLVLAYLSLAYFTSGLSKIRHGGLAWLNGRTLAFYLRGVGGYYLSAATDAAPHEKWRDGFGLVSFTYGLGPRPSTSAGFAKAPAEYTRLGEWLGRNEAAARGMAVFAFLVELTFPVVLVVPALLWPYLVLAGAFHVGVYATMRLPFLNYIPCYLVFVDWPRVLAVLRLLSGG